MANRNLNSKQFGEDSHKQVISDLEEHHGIEFTPAGLRHSEGKMTPISGVWAENEGWAEGSDPGHQSMHFKLPTEDPDVDNTMWLGYPQENTRHEFENSTGVLTSEEHHYRQSDRTTTRLTKHADITSAMKHLDQGARDRAGHLEKGTSPSTEESGRTGMNGKWVNYPRINNYKDNMRQPPNIINYYSGHPDDNNTAYEVDTGTRERIPDKDQ